MRDCTDTLLEEIPSLRKVKNSGEMIQYLMICGEQKEVNLLITKESVYNAYS